VAKEHGWNFTYYYAKYVAKDKNQAIERLK
jgi:hypothetical protein